MAIRGSNMGRLIQLILVKIHYMETYWLVLFSRALIKVYSENIRYLIEPEMTFFANQKIKIRK